MILVIVGFAIGPFGIGGGGGGDLQFGGEIFLLSVVSHFCNLGSRGRFWVLLSIEPEKYCNTLLKNININESVLVVNLIAKELRKTSNMVEYVDRFVEENWINE